MIVAYTAGVYDLFHVGHLNLLKNAKANCDKLVVGVTTDELAEARGKKIFVPFSERLEIVRSIKYVDDAVSQADMDKISMCKKIGATKLIVGDDWKGTERWLQYEEEAKEAGVEIMYLPYTKHTSSTQLRKALGL